MSGFCGNKTQAAFLFSFDKLVEYTEGKLYFWTFTAANECTDSQFRWAWREFMDRVSSSYEGCLCGLRVFERHHGGGERDGQLHCHAVVDRRVYVQRLRRLAIGTGMGRMQVAKAGKGLGDYLSKYLTKEHALRDGIRSWAAFGAWEHTRKLDVEFHSEEADMYRAVYRGFRGQPNAWALTRVECEKIKLVQYKFPVQPLGSYPPEDLNAAALAESASMAHGNPF